MQEADVRGPRTGPMIPGSGAGAPLPGIGFRRIVLRLLFDNADSNCAKGARWVRVHLQQERGACLIRGDVIRSCGAIHRDLGCGAARMGTVGGECAGYRDASVLNACHSRA